MKIKNKKAKRKSNKPAVHVQEFKNKDTLFAHDLLSKKNINDDLQLSLEIFL